MVETSVDVLKQVLSGQILVSDKLIGSAILFLLKLTNMCSRCIKEHTITVVFATHNDSVNKGVLRGNILNKNSQYMATDMTCTAQPKITFEETEKKRN